jgi:hypothetical protein
MTFVPAMWAIWSVFVAMLVALYVYRTSLTRDEQDQIFLDDSFDHERVAQAAIMQKINKVKPLVRLTSGLAAASSAVLLGYYVVDWIREFQ